MHSHSIVTVSEAGILRAQIISSIVRTSQYFIVTVPIRSIITMVFFSQKSYVNFGFFSHEDCGHEYGVVKKCKENHKNASTKNKNIVISFDGTGGEPGWGIQKGDKNLYSGVGGLSNCCKMHLIAGGNIGNSQNHFDVNDQIALYYSGVGTRGNLQVLKSMLGLGEMKDIYTMAYEDLKKVYQKGDRLYIFGFSRGAATARLFCSYLNNNPITDSKTGTEVAFLGVFDTVCESLPVCGGVGVSDSPRVLDVNKSDSGLPQNVKKAMHLVSIDENRAPFTPTLFNKDPRVTEIWCPGIHSDVGGGYYHDGLSDLTLHIMKMAAEEEEMRCRTITEDTCTNDRHTLFDCEEFPHLDGKKAFCFNKCKKIKPHDADECTEDAEAFNEFDNDMKIEPNALDEDIHNEMSAMYVVLNFLKGFEYRRPRKMKDDDDWNGEPILLLDAALERVKHWFPSEVPETFEIPAGSYDGNKYRPKALVDVPFKIFNRHTMEVKSEVYKFSPSFEMESVPDKNL